MPRRAGVKMHHGRMPEGRPRMPGTRPGSITRNSAFQFDPISLLSRPDLASPGDGAERKGMGGAESRAAARAWRAPDLPRSEHRGRLISVGLRPALALLPLFEAKAVAVYSRMWTWWVSRSSSARVNLSAPNTPVYSTSRRSSCRPIADESLRATLEETTLAPDFAE